VLLVAGAARLHIDGEPGDRSLAAGDFILLPAHCRHRVTWTDEAGPTVWLAIHFGKSRS
jgi:cupin 2 domain-containing protein